MNEDELIDVIRCVLVEEGRICEHTGDDGPGIIVDVDDVAWKLAGEILNPRPR